MKIGSAISILLNIVSSAFVVGQTQPYPNLWNIQVRADIVHNNSEQVFHYVYTVINSNTSVGKIDELEIDISRKSTTLDIDTVGLRFKNDGFTEENFRLDFPHLQGKIIPVGFTRSPEKWTAGLSNNSTATFFTTRSYAIQIGQSLSGFEMTSRGLPSIRRCIVSPFFDVIALFPDPEDTTITYYVPPVDSVRQAVKFHTYTIGPTAPPIDFVPSVWLDTLASYKHQAVALGWIVDRREEKNEKDEMNDDGIVAKLDKRLDKARAALFKGDSSKAREELREFVKKVEELYNETQEHEKERKNDKVTFTSEAYALLKFNAEYLIDRLPKEKGERAK